MTAIKKKLLFGLVFVLIAALAGAAGYTVAYFTDSKQITNVFTSGSVYISLTEAAVKPDADGNLIEDPDAPRIDGAEVGAAEVVHNYTSYNGGKLFPGQSICKDPTVKNTGSESAWIAVKLILKDGGGDLHNVLHSGDNLSLDLSEFLVGGLLDLSATVGEWQGHESVRYNERFAMIQVPDRASGTYTFYIFILRELLPSEEVEIMNEISIPYYWGNAEMKELTELTITVQAFAVQKMGFADSYSAMLAAFPTHFPITAP